MMPRHLLSLSDWGVKEISEVIKLASEIKINTKKFENRLKRKSLLMIFAKPSLRTHLSFDVAMYKLGGHAIFYDLSDSVLGKKESIKDFSKVISQYVDVIMARLYEHKDLVDLARYADVPVINGLTNYFHPCQILGDFLTIEENLGKLKGKKICFLGDANNNITHSLIEGGNKLGLSVTVSCPKNKNFLPNENVIGNLKYEYERNPVKAVRDADVIYTDSWMSYHIPKSQEKKRINTLKPWQVNKRLFTANKKAIFMHCLPATRGIEVTDEIIDSPRSVVYKQAGNRLYSEQAVLLKLLK